MADANLSVNPTELVSAAADLDKLADRLASTLHGAAERLRVPSAGRDEVSTASATSFTTVADGFGKDAADGVRELRKIAAILRSQATGVDAADDEVSAAFKI
ncbi:PE family protein [Gordonia soli]|uniref:PE domain-containing protein n=1 Tax=Gordonia soli NBRC 108243 TaxID=1223545 RepID=M0QFL7_9ACTN|nr:PE family protein [Gordonia soli]GAC66207.1 hypothetical protein GS4_01_00080 [Gordonia soli NBRC 108243]